MCIRDSSEPVNLCIVSLHQLRMLSYMYIQWSDDKDKLDVIALTEIFQAPYFLSISNGCVEFYNCKKKQVKKIAGVPENYLLLKPSISDTSKFD